MGNDLCWYMQYINAALMRLFTRAAFKHHADPMGVRQPPVIRMMVECSTGELLPRVTFMYHDDKEHSELKHSAAFKPLSTA